MKATSVLDLIEKIRAVKTRAEFVAVLDFIDAENENPSFPISGPEMDCIEDALRIRRHQIAPREVAA